MCRGMFGCRPGLDDRLDETLCYLVAVEGILV